MQENVIVQQNLHSNLSAYSLRDKMVFKEEDLSKLGKPFIGKKLRECMGEETYWKWRENIKGKPNSIHGKWIVNNGYENKWVDPGCIPEGYIRGYCARSKLNPKNQSK